MGLNIVTDSGDFVPYVKYNAKAGRWYVKGDSGDVEVMSPVFVADFANIRTGWLYFSAGSAPERVMDETLTHPAPKPDRTYTDDKGKVRDCFSRGFMLDLFSDACFGGVAELSSTSAVMNKAINGLYEQYEVSPEAQAGKLPVVKFVQAAPITGKHGTNYEPVFQIEKWVDRPAAFDVDTPVVAQVAPVQPAPVAVGANSVSEF